VSEEDLESEFQKLTADLLEDSTFQVSDEPVVAPKRRVIGLVLAPIDNAGALATLLKLSGTEVAVVKVKPWSAAWIEVSLDDSVQEDDVALLLSGQRPIPTEVDQLARTISKLTPYGAVAIASWLSTWDDQDSQTTGTISAKRYVGGEPEADIEPGMLMAQIDNAAEELLLGRATPDDFPDTGGGLHNFFRRPRGGR
jgi:hypothetical protein